MATSADRMFARESIFRILDRVNIMEKKLDDRQERALNEGRGERGARPSR